jgi:hypothetical protein
VEIGPAFAANSQAFKVVQPSVLGKRRWVVEQSYPRSANNFRDFPLGAAPDPADEWHRVQQRGELRDLVAVAPGSR